MGRDTRRTHRPDDMNGDSLVTGSGVFFAEIDAAHVFVRADLFRCAFKQDIALEHDGGAIDNIEGLAYPVVGDENTDIAFFKIED